MDKAAQTMIGNLEKNTGKNLQQWIEIVKQKGLLKHGEIIAFLKSEHGFTHGFANLVSLKARGADAGSAKDSETLVEKQYKDKENLRPLYDKLIDAVRQFGADVEIAPKRKYVSLRRKKQFALIQPSTHTRLDVGINFKNTVPTSRLEISGGFSNMCSHRVRLEDVTQVDNQLIEWLKLAYEEAG
ncbi:MAG: DUF4287 domain-containing protein [bacterium]|jgi:predicted transport protein